jgi:hypothetical protein
MRNLERWTARQSQDEKAWGICIQGEGKPRWIIYPTKELDDQDAALIMAAHNAAVEKRGERSIICGSITNSKLEPIVEIVLGPEVAHFRIREARQLITQLQEATEAAMSDALLSRFIRDYVYRNSTTADANHAIGSMLVMFREFRKSIDTPVIETGEQ